MITTGFSHAYLNQTDFNIIEHFDDGSTRTVSPEYHLYQEWTGEVPVISGDEFVTIQNGQPVVNHQKAAILEARAWGAVRSRRNQLISACDWTQLSDAPLTAAQKSAWQEYRQSLRDLPQTFTKSSEVVWPVKPTK